MTATSAIQTWFQDNYDCYVTAMKALHVTLQAMLELPAATQRPEQDTGVANPPGGLHDLNRDTCRGRGICPRRVPGECVAIEYVRRGKDVIVTRRGIDSTICPFCSIACEAAPRESPPMENESRLDPKSRQDCAKEFVVETHLPEWAHQRLDAPPEKAAPPKSATLPEGAAG